MAYLGGGREVAFKACAHPASPLPHEGDGKRAAGKPGWWPNSGFSPEASPCPQRAVRLMLGKGVPCRPSPDVPASPTRSAPQGRVSHFLRKLPQHLYTPLCGHRAQEASYSTHSPGRPRGQELTCSPVFPGSDIATDTHSRSSNTSRRTRNRITPCLPTSR